MEISIKTVPSSARQAALALAAHIAHRQQYLLPVGADAEDNEERDRRRLPVEPDTHDGTVEDQPDDVFLAQLTL
jgi:hypothetical protein